MTPREFDTRSRSPSHAARLAAFALAAFALAAPANAAEIRVLTAGAMKDVVLALAPAFEKETGHKLIVDNDTVGGLTKRIEAGEAFDLGLLTPAAVDALIAKGHIAAGTRQSLARVGIGVAVKAGAPKPDISNVEALKAALRAAKSVSYTDPKLGGSSGIYFDGLLERLGLAAEVRAKAKLMAGGALVSALVAKGEAELGITQISEIVPVKEAALAGPLPADVQTYTTYAAGIAAKAKEAEAAKALLAKLASAEADAALTARGMERAR
jgi:molybdate transport system substrate-binding protein